ncbi:MFS transporter TsgA [Shewanella sp. OPT22]|nr:MFS transporter TsgA [Shewanella sp. OPT22]
MNFNLNKGLLCVIAFLSYMVPAALVTQSGVLIKPLSVYLGIELTEAGSMFSFVTGGALTGSIISMFIFDKLSLKNVFRAFYILFIGASLLLATTKSIPLVSVCFIALGAVASVGLAAGAILITRIFEEKYHASAFIVTDCAFSASGFIFPTLTVTLLAAGAMWYNAFISVNSIIGLVLVLSFFVTFPKVTKDELKEDKDAVPFNENIWTVRVILFGLLIGGYLVVQNSLITWGPTYLMTELGAEEGVAYSMIGRFFGPAVLGLLITAAIVTKISARLMMVFVVISTVCISIYMTLTPSVDSFLIAVTILGFLTASIYKIFISVGASQIKNAPPRLITFLLMCGSTGATIAPVLSSYIVKTLGEGSIMYIISGGFCFIAIVALCTLFLEHREVKSH